MKLLFTVPWDCEPAAVYNTGTVPIPRIGEVVLAWADLEKRLFANSPKMPRQVRCIVSSVTYDLVDMAVTVTLENA